MIYSPVGIIAGLHKPKKSFKKEDIGFLASNGAIVLFKKDQLVTNKMTVIGNITRPSDLGSGDPERLGGGVRSDAPSFRVTNTVKSVSASTRTPFAYAFPLLCLHHVTLYYTPNTRSHSLPPSKAKGGQAAAPPLLLLRGLQGTLLVEFGHDALPLSADLAGGFQQAPAKLFR